MSAGVDIANNYEMVVLKAANPKVGFSFDQVYINSGTWRAVHEMVAAGTSLKSLAAIR